MIKDYLRFYEPEKIDYSKSFYTNPIKTQELYKFPQNDAGLYKPNPNNIKEIIINKNNSNVYGINEYDNLKINNQKHESEKNIFDWLGIPSNKTKMQKTYPLTDPQSEYGKITNLQYILNSVLTTYNPHEEPINPAAINPTAITPAEITENAINENKNNNNKNNAKKTTLSPVQPLEKTEAVKSEPLRKSEAATSEPFRKSEAATSENFVTPMNYKKNIIKIIHRMIKQQ